METEQDEGRTIDTHPESTSLTERVSSGLKASLAEGMLSAFSNAILVFVLTRFLLDPRGYGLLQFSLSVIGVASLFGSLGIPKSAARYLTEYVEKDSTQVRYILRTSLLYMGVLAFVSAVGLAAFSGPLARVLGEPSLAPFLFVGAAYIVFDAFSIYLTTIFQAFNRVTWSAVIGAVAGVGRLVFVIAFVVIGLGAFGALLGYVVGFAVAVLVGLAVLYTRFYSAFETSERPEHELSRRILEYSLPLTATKSAGVLDGKVDAILIGMILNPVAVGYYVLAKQIAEFTTVPVASLGFTISPAFGKQKASDRLDRAARVYEESLSHVLLAYIPAAVGLILLAEPLIRHVFGAEYIAAVPAVQTLSGFVLIHAVNKITSDGLDYLGLARSRAVAKIVMGISNALLNLLLIPVFGIVGAAIATVITYSGYTLFNVHCIHRELSFRIPLVFQRVAVACAISIAMGLAVFLSRPYVSNLLSLFAVVLLGIAVWALLAVLSGALNLRRVVTFLQ